MAYSLVGWCYLGFTITCYNWSLRTL